MFCPFLYEKKYLAGQIKTHNRRVFPGGFESQRTLSPLRSVLLSSGTLRLPANPQRWKAILRHLQDSFTELPEVSAYAGRIYYRRYVRVLLWNRKRKHRLWTVKKQGWGLGYRLGISRGSYFESFLSITYLAFQRSHSIDGRGDLKNARHGVVLMFRECLIPKTSPLLA